MSNIEFKNGYRGGERTDSGVLQVGKSAFVNGCDNMEEICDGKHAEHVRHGRSTNQRNCLVRKSGFGEYRITDVAATLKADGGDIGGGTESLILRNMESGRLLMRNKLQMGAAGTGGSRQDYPCYTLKIRQPRDPKRGGAGALIQIEKAMTLATSQDQYLIICHTKEKQEQ